MKTYNGFPIVNSLSNLQVGRIYATKNYKMLTPIVGNRGMKNSIKTAKVNEFKKLLESGDFFDQASYVLINLIGKIIEGHHRKELLQRANAYVCFMITGQPQFNVKDKSKLLNAISRFNSINAKWTGKDVVASALDTNEPLAVGIDDLKAELLASYGTSMLTEGRIIALLTEDRKKLHGSINDREIFCNVDLAKKLKTKMFNNTITFVVKVAQLVESFQINGLKTWNVIKGLMPMIWDNEANMDKMYHLLAKDRFKGLPSVDLKTIEARLRVLASKRVNKNTNLIPWN